MLSALIFDVDGTLADTESTHRRAFNAAFRDAGLDWHWNETLYTQLLEVSGGKERIRHYWSYVAPEAANDRGFADTIKAIHANKTRHYEAMINSGTVRLRPGVLRLIQEAQVARMPIAIATTTTFANVDALLGKHLGGNWRSLFAAIVDGSAKGPKKPAPDVYLQALEQLGLCAEECIAFEDSQNGLRAARAAGIPTVVTPTAYTAAHRFEDALVVVPHLGDPEHPMPQRLPGTDERWVDLAALRRWHQGTLFEAA